MKEYSENNSPLQNNKEFTPKNNNSFKNQKCIMSEQVLSKNISKNMIKPQSIIKNKNMIGEKLALQHNNTQELVNKDVKKVGIEGKIFNLCQFQV